MTSSNNTLLQAFRNGKLEIEGATDDQARQCARILRDAQKHDGSTTTTGTIKSIELRRGSITSVGAGSLAKALKGAIRHKIFYIWSGVRTASHLRIENQVVPLEGRRALGDVGGVGEGGAYIGGCVHLDDRHYCCD